MTRASLLHRRAELQALLAQEQTAARVHQDNACTVEGALRQVDWCLAEGEREEAERRARRAMFGDAGRN